MLLGLSEVWHRNSLSQHQTLLSPSAINFGPLPFIFSQ